MKDSAGCGGIELLINIQCCQVNNIKVVDKWENVGLSVSALLQLLALDTFLLIYVTSLCNKRMTNAYLPL